MTVLYVAGKIADTVNVPSEKGKNMTSGNENEIPPGTDDMVALLNALSESQEQKIGEVIDLNHDIVLASRKMAHNILKIRQAHLEEASRLYEIANELIESAVISSQIAADMIDVEFGGQVIDLSKFNQEDEEDEDDE